MTLGSLPSTAGCIQIYLFLHFFSTLEDQGLVQCLILAVILFLVGFLLLNLLADLKSRNRRLSEEIVYRVCNLEPRQLVMYSSIGDWNAI